MFTKDLLAPVTPESSAATKEIMVGAARNRVNNWVASTVDDRKLINAIHDGLVMGVRIENHQFRDRNKSQERSKRALGPQK